MHDVVICEPVRTAVGRFGGQFRDLSAHELAATVLHGLIERSGLDKSKVEDVIFAQCYPSMDAPALGRMAALDAGFPVTVGGLQLDRRCGSGLQAVIYAVMQVATGASDIVVAGGAESMSNAPIYSTAARWGIRGNSLQLHDSLARGRVMSGGKNHPVPGGMLETAENLRREYSISREEQDEFAVGSHAKAVAAQQDGRFNDEIVPVQITSHKTGTIKIATDEHPRPGTGVDDLANLKPMLGQKIKGATVTAGNASGQNDGASACIVTTRELAEKFGFRIFGQLVSWAVAGVPPDVMGIGPVPAVERALKRVNLLMKDMDLIELNEAFAAQAIACTRGWKFNASDFDRLNVNGSGISLGHPVGATGGRILSTLLREMARRDAEYGIETMCIGGGQGLAAVFQRAT